MQAEKGKEKGQHLTLCVSLSVPGAERLSQVHDHGDRCRCQTNVRKSTERTEPLQDLTDEVRLKQPDFFSCAHKTRTNYHLLISMNCNIHIKTNPTGMEATFCSCTLILIVILPSTAGISWSLIKNSCLNIIMSVKRRQDTILYRNMHI